MTKQLVANPVINYQPTQTPDTTAQPMQTGVPNFRGLELQGCNQVRLCHNHTGSAQLQRSIGFSAFGHCSTPNTLLPSLQTNLRSLQGPAEQPQFDQGGLTQYNPVYSRSIDAPQVAQCNMSRITVANQQSAATVPQRPTGLPQQNAIPNGMPTCVFIQSQPQRARIPSQYDSSLPVKKSEQQTSHQI